MEKVNLEATVMAIRENLMRYYKGTCVESVTENSNVYRNRLTEYVPGRPRYQYQREREQYANGQLLIVGNVPILTLQQTPDRLTYHIKMLGLSTGLKEVHQEIRKFMSRHLKGVKQINNTAANLGKGITYSLPNSVDDTSLFQTRAVREQQSRPTMSISGVDMAEIAIDYDMLVRHQRELEQQMMQSQQIQQLQQSPTIYFSPRQYSSYGDWLTSDDD